MRLARKPYSCAGLSSSGGSRRRLRGQSAFTLVEIALCIAIIGFALVAIIGVLPAGLNVQKENREETIIVHEANYFIDAIRSGARGLDDLTNYVEAITNYVSYFNANGQPVGPVEVRGYTDTRFATNSTGIPTPWWYGSNIVGLLSTPRYIFQNNKPYLETPVPQGFSSNYLVAYVRALSGPAVEKVPQANPLVRDLAFRYRLICELSSYSNWNTNWVNFNATGLTLDEIITRSNNWRVARSLQGNMNELRLLFRWPVDSKRAAGNQRQVFRTLVGGALTNTPNASEFWFVQPEIYQTAQ
jgi:type II secretory pathway pseudopilin PulG